MDLELWKPNLVSITPRFSTRRSNSGNGAVPSPRSPTSSAPGIQENRHAHKHTDTHRHSGENITAVMLQEKKGKSLTAKQPHWFHGTTAEVGFTNDLR